MSRTSLETNGPSFLLVFLLILFSSANSQAQAPEETPAIENPAHAELRAVRDEAIDAFTKRDIDRLLACLHENVVITLQNAEVCKGHEQVRAFHERMSEGENPSVQSQESEFQVDDLSVIYGEDTAIANGSIKDDFKLATGMEFHLDSRWSATLVKEDGRWLVASFHASTNMFDNGVSDLMLKWNTIAVGAIAMLAGILATVIVARIRKRRS